MHKKNRSMLAVIISASLFCYTSHALADANDPLQGLWSGTDPSDGGLQHWSIAATLEKGVYQVRGSDTYLRLCAGNRGAIWGQGTLDQTGNLVVPIEIQCFANPTNEKYIAPVALTLQFKPHQSGYLLASSVSNTDLAPTTLFKSGSTSDSLDGVWAGTDPDDGGLQTWTIARKGNAYQVRVSDTYLRTCTGNRGSVLGKGQLDQDGNLNTDVEVQCFTNPTNEAYLKPVNLNFTFKHHALGYWEVSTHSGVTQQSTTLFKIAGKTNFE